MRIRPAGHSFTRATVLDEEQIGKVLRHMADSNRGLRWHRHSTGNDMPVKDVFTLSLMGMSSLVASTSMMSLCSCWTSFIWVFGHFSHLHQRPLRLSFIEHSLTTEIACGLSTAMTSIQQLSCSCRIRYHFSDIITILDVLLKPLVVFQEGGNQSLVQILDMEQGRFSPV